MVHVENTTRNVTLLDAGNLADNPWTRLRGLIGVKDLPAGKGLLIKPCHGVHCMFMSIPIDVVYVDRENRVVAVDHTMKPWHMGKIYSKSAFVIELPAGSVGPTGTQPGDQLQVREH